MSDHDPGLDAIMRTDRFVDALASGARMSSVDPLSAMLGEWRDDVRRQPDARVVTMAQASAALARLQKPPRRNRFALTVVGGLAAAVLCLGGFGAIVLDARPGDALYGLRSTVFGERTETRNEAVTLAAQELDQVQQLVNQGNWDEAQQKLVTLGPTVQSVSDAQSKQQLVEQYNSLTAKVIQRDPQAAPPPPGVPPPVNPSSPLTFLQVPVIVETTTTAPSIPDLTTTSGPTTALPSPTPTTALPMPASTTELPSHTTTLPSYTTTLPTPTTTLPSSTRATPSPTSSTEPPTRLRTTAPTTLPTAPTSAQVTATTTAAQEPPSLPVTVTTPPAESTVPLPLETTRVAPPPETPRVAPPEMPRGPQRPPPAITTPMQAPGGPGPR
jgi:hypothetical protein